MTELGVDMSEEFPKPLTDEVVAAADVVITMGCGDACPIYPGKKLRGLGARRPGRPERRDRARDPRRARRARAEADRRAAPGRQLTAPPLARALVAEAIGTFALVFAGCGAIMVDQKTGALGHVGVAITFGLVIMAMIYAVGHVSGAHFNPAVTLLVRARAALPEAAPRAVLGRAARRARCSRRRSCAARSATSRTSAPPIRAAPTHSRSSGRASSRSS